MRSFCTFPAFEEAQVNGAVRLCFCVLSLAAVADPLRIVCADTGVTVRETGFALLWWWEPGGAYTLQCTLRFGRLGDTLSITEKTTGDQRARSRRGPTDASEWRRAAAAFPLSPEHVFSQYKLSCTLFRTPCLKEAEVRERKEDSKAEGGSTSFESPSWTEEPGFPCRRKRVIRTQ